MPNTIGAKWIKKVKELAKEADKKNMYGVNEVLNYIECRLPEKVFNIWEGAYDEVKHISDNYVLFHISR